ncbi:MAG: hypothetical protein WDN03_00875 [Rhizomicrobium sp.]
MIGLDAREDLFLLGLAARIGGVPGELDLGVVGLRAGIGEEHLADRERRDLLQLLGQRDGGLVALAAEQMAEGELAHLLRRDLGQLVLAPAQRGAPQPRHRLDIVLAVLVVDVAALAAVDHHRAGLAEFHQVGVGCSTLFTSRIWALLRGMRDSAGDDRPGL